MRDRLNRGEEKRARRWLPRLTVVLFAIVIAVVTLRTGPRPALEVEAGLPGIGRSTPLRITAAAGGRGLAGLRVTLRQGEISEIVLDRAYRSRPAWSFWGERTGSVTEEISVGSDTVATLTEGEAVVAAEVWAPGTWLRDGPRARREITLPVLLRPPSLVVVSTQHYPAQGGCEVVLYRVGPTAVRDGVRVAGEWFPGYSLPDSPSDLRFALFAVPFDVATADELRLEAEDAVGNTARARFVDKFFPRDFRRDRVEVSRAFMASVVPEIQANTPGLEGTNDLVTDYVTINRDLRRENAETLRELAADGAKAFLWREAFLALPNAKVMSNFADRRTYLHGGREIDEQVHLGFDLASVQRAEVPAAATGRVALARYFGIYGNSVVLDHGYGLMTLYGHLSSLEVEEGREVERGDVLGTTGKTGLAAGDHLHFTVLLNGVAVNPVEWWDGKWIRDRLGRKLGESLPR